MKFSLSQINTMIPSEFEQLREQGEEYRLDLSNSVTALLPVPQGWQVNAEYRSEFGGLFPVQCRFTPDGEALALCVCSPGEVSPVWLAVLLGADGSLVRVLHQSESLEPGAVGELLEKVAGMHRFNCTAGTVATLLAQEVAA
ncbi:conjugation system SOS inhibitor PsiB [Cronobacter sakazakii]